MYAAIYWDEKRVCVWGGGGGGGAVKDYGALYATSLCSCFGLNDIGLFRVLNATFNNISVISWWSFLLVEEITDLPEVTYCSKSTPRMGGIRAHNFIGGMN